MKRLVSYITTNKPSNADDYFELFGLSTDIRPVEKIGDMYIPDGSTFFCIDSGALYVYDSENKKWYLK